MLADSLNLLLYPKALHHRRDADRPDDLRVFARSGASAGFDMSARQAFTVEMTSREDLLNAISLNSSQRVRLNCYQLTGS